MSKLKATKGKYKFDLKDKSNIRISFNNPTMDLWYNGDDEMTFKTKSFDEALATAVLLSKAPEMYRTLKQMIKIYESPQFTGKLQDIYNKSVRLINEIENYNEKK